VRDPATPRASRRNRNRRAGYLSGTLMFVAGLAIIRVHNVWTRNWTVLVTRLLFKGVRPRH